MIIRMSTNMSTIMSMNMNIITSTSMTILMSTATRTAMSIIITITRPFRTSKGSSAIFLCPIG